MRSPRLPRGPKKNRAKARGNEGERELARLLTKAFERHGVDDIQAQRVLTESRTGSYDIEIYRRSLDGEQVLPIAIQAKNVTAQFGGYLLKAWYEARAWSDDTLPIGATKVPSRRGFKKRDQWLVSLSAEYFGELFAKAHAYDIQNGSPSLEDSDTTTAAEIIGGSIKRRRKKKRRSLR